MQRFLIIDTLAAKSFFIFLVLFFGCKGFAVCELTIDGVVPEQKTVTLDLEKDCLPPGLSIPFKGPGQSTSQQNRHLVLVCYYNSFIKGPYRITMQMLGETSSIRFGEAETELRAGFDIKDVHLGFRVVDNTAAHLLCY